MAEGKGLQLERVDAEICSCRGLLAVLVILPYWLLPARVLGAAKAGHVEGIVSINAELQVLISHGPEPLNSDRSTFL